MCNSECLLVVLSLLPLWNFRERPTANFWCPLARHLNSIGARDVTLGQRETNKNVVGIYPYWTGQLEIIINIFCFVLFCWCVRLYFSFGYVRSQNSIETMPSRKVFCEMKDGFLIGIDTNEGGTYIYDSASNQGTVEYIFRVTLRFL